MTRCKTENWTVKDISDALTDKHKDNKHIVVPMFQRGERWDGKQQKAFIDSLQKGYPVGTLLFYEKFENNQWQYILVDGLQRGSCIRKYMTDPTEFFFSGTDFDKVCVSIQEIIGESNRESYTIIRNMITSYIKAEVKYSPISIQYYDIAHSICDHFKKTDHEFIQKIIDTLKNFSIEKQNLYNSIAETTIPINIYNGPEETLPEIFERINSQGTPLDQYEIYAATWPLDKKYDIHNSEIVEYVVKKYEDLNSKGYTLDNYFPDDLRRNKRLNAFEYLFGLGRYLTNKFDILPDDTKAMSDNTVVNPIGFELVNACLNDTNYIRMLYKNLDKLDINALESALENAIKFVADSISVITRFKGNTRKENRILHPKYLIMSMISTSFKWMYPTTENLVEEDPLWVERKQAISRNLRNYYVYDIITNYWGEGGTSKLYTAPKRYSTELTAIIWSTELEKFYAKSMSRKEIDKVASPKKEEYVLLNCIYVNSFTALDQLSIDKFDVEHIAPKKQLAKLIKICNGEGLPISCIANLCYLPESANRIKKEKNFYQDEKYCELVKLDEVEKKYSFTKKEDLEWMDYPYQGPNDFEFLKESYTAYCRKRFEKLKQLFCNSMGIQYIPSDMMDMKIDKKNAITADNQNEITVPPKTTISSAKKKKNSIDFSSKCAQRLSNIIGEDLIIADKKSNKVFKTKNNKYGFVICTTSKEYIQGKRIKYWFAYRRIESISNCEEQYCIFSFMDENTMIKLPISFMEANIDKFRFSTKNGVISHWHIVFFKDSSGHMTLFFSNPHSSEISVDEYKV